MEINYRRKEELGEKLTMALTEARNQQKIVELMGFAWSCLAICRDHWLFSIQVYTFVGAQIHVNDKYSGCLVTLFALRL